MESLFAFRNASLYLFLPPLNINSTRRASSISSPSSLHIILMWFSQMQPKPPHAPKRTSSLSRMMSTPVLATSIRHCLNFFINSGSVGQAKRSIFLPFKVFMVVKGNCSSNCSPQNQAPTSYPFCLKKAHASFIRDICLWYSSLL